MKILNNCKKILNSKWFIFLIAFTIMFFTIFDYKDLCGGSMDAMETWNVVKTFFSKNHVYSYVMYKGIYAFIPGVISYNLGLFFHINEFLILKILNSLGFAYICVIGLPHLIKKLLNKKEVKTYQYYLFVFLFYLLENSTFCVISVDYYSAVFFTMLCNCFIRLYENVNKKNLIIFGLLVGLNLSLSGQFSLATYIILLFIIINLIKNNLKTISKKNVMKVVVSLSIILGGYVITSLPNALYEEFIVNEGREKGEWIPAGSDWIKTGMSRDMLIINYPASIQDNIGYSIMTDRNDNIEIVKMGGTIYNYSDYIKIFLQYPVEFTIRIFERIFLGIVNDYKNSSFISQIHSNTTINLLIMISCVYIVLLTMKNRIKKVKDIFNYKAIIILGSLLTILPPSLLHVENRYYLYIRGLILGTSIFLIFMKRKNIDLKNIMNAKINYKVIAYIIFLLLCISLYIAIYQTTTTNANL